MKELVQNHPRLLTALYILLILLLMHLTVTVIKWLVKRLETQDKWKYKDRISHKLLKNTLITIVYVVGILTAINQIPSLSNTVYTVLAGSGVLAVIVGLAAQESFGNLISGIILTLFRPFEVGDRVRLVEQDLNGNIEDITLRHTVIRTPTDNRVIVPNTALSSAIVENTNYIQGAPKKNYIEVDISYDSDLELAMNIMAEVISSHPYYIGDRPLRIYVPAFAASGITLRGTMTTATVEENYIACSEARISLKKAFDEQGVVIPFTTVTVVSADAAKAGAANDRESQLVSDKSND